MRMKQIVIFGSTGSVGTKALQICERNPESFKVIGLTTNTNIKKLLEQINQFRPRYVAITDDNARNEFTKYKPPFVQVLSVDELSCIKVDCVINGMVGISGLKPSMNVLKNGGTLGIANKEPIVAAGRLLREQAERYGSTIIPVDSEHSAIFQTLEERHRAAVDRILLTASGGPFREKDTAFMAQVTPEQAVAHPNWSMGAKISVDSATMMNKGLEIIEAYHLFGFGTDRIEVLVHPQSIVHSAVAYIDGSVLAHLGMPDMRTPIAYALAYPDRMESPTKPLDLTALSGLTFSHPDEAKFPALRVAKAALNKGQTATAVMNAANEVAVGAFLNRKIGFLDIVKTVEAVLDKMSLPAVRTIEDVIAVDAQAREQAAAVIRERA